MASSNYATVTETPGIGVSAENVDMLLTRYQFAATYSAGRDVLEVACGTGCGLGYLSQRARSVVGGDITPGLLAIAHAHYGTRLPLVRLDGQRLPFGAGTFDTLLLFEAIYYLSDPGAFVRECRRVLRPRGIVVICSVNPQWSEFNPSPFSTRYLTADDLEQLMRDAGFEVTVLGAFPAGAGGMGHTVVGALKRAAVRQGLMPKTMRGKERLKRLFHGPLVDYPSELRDGVGRYHSPTALGVDAGAWKVLYAVGRLD